MERRCIAIVLPLLLYFLGVEGSPLPTSMDENYSDYHNMDDLPPQVGTRTEALKRSPGLYSPDRTNNDMDQFGAIDPTGTGLEQQEGSTGFKEKVGKTVASMIFKNTNRTDRSGSRAGMLIWHSAGSGAAAPKTFGYLSRQMLKKQAITYPHFLILLLEDTADSSLLLEKCSYRLFSPFKHTTFSADFSNTKNKIYVVEIIHNFEPTETTNPAWEVRKPHNFSQKSVCVTKGLADDSHSQKSKFHRQTKKNKKPQLVSSWQITVLPSLLVVNRRVPFYA